MDFKTRNQLGLGLNILNPTNKKKPYILLIRHGKPGSNEEIVPSSADEIKILAERINIQYPGRTKILISSEALRAENTAKIIGSVLKIQNSTNPTFNQDFSNSEEQIRMIDHLCSGSDIVIIVTHAPVIGAILNGYSGSGWNIVMGNFEYGTLYCLDHETKRGRQWQK